MNASAKKLKPAKPIDANAAMYDEKQTAVYLGTTSGVVRLSRHTGELWAGVPAPRFIRAGRAVRYRKCDLDDFLENLPGFLSNADARSKGVDVRIIPRGPSARV